MATTDNKWQELQQRYGEMSDAEVVGLYEHQDDLTDIAREALVAEFRKRGLTAKVAEEVSRPDDDAADGLVYLWNFVDGIEASETLRVLQTAEIAAQLKPVPQDVTRSDDAPLLAMELYVPEADRERAILLLRRYKGLFPLPEQQLEEDYELEDSDMFVIAEFDNAQDAQLASSGLSAQLVRFRKSEDTRDGQTIWIFEVPQNDVDRAGDAIEHALRGAATDASDR